jgi:hypothetical protein
MVVSAVHDAAKTTIMYVAGVLGKSILEYRFAARAHRYHRRDADLPLSGEPSSWWSFLPTRGCIVRPASLRGAVSQ